MSFAGTSIPTFSKILENFFSELLAGTLWDILATSTHSHLECWALAQYYLSLSMLTSRPDNSLLIFWDRATFSSNFFTHSFNSLNSSSTACWIDSFFSWRFIENAISSDFVSFLSDSSADFGMVRKKLASYNIKLKLNNFKTAMLDKIFGTK